MPPRAFFRLLQYPSDVVKAERRHSLCIVVGLDDRCELHHFYCVKTFSSFLFEAILLPSVTGQAMVVLFPLTIRKRFCWSVMVAEMREPDAFHPCRFMFGVLLLRRPEFAAASGLFCPASVKIATVTRKFSPPLKKR